MSDSDTPPTEPTGEASDIGEVTPFVPTVADFRPEAIDDPFAELTHLEEKMGRALIAFAKTLNVPSSCKAAGIKYDTWFTWRRRHPAFTAMLERIRVESLPEVEDAMFREAKDGNVEAAKTILKAHDPKYRERQVIEVVSPDVQRRLAAQVDAIMHTCRTELDGPTATMLIPKIAAALDEVWS